MLSEPFEQFKIWFVEVSEAMTLATVDESGMPDARIVLLKEVTEDAFVFFTNYQSAKAQQLQNMPYAACVFWWPKLERQVRIRGPVSKISPEQSDAYFQTRPRGSQIGALVSKQSQELKNRAELEIAWLEIEKKYNNQLIPRPDYWGGYCLKPVHFEFWQGRENRLHDRVAYNLSPQGIWEQKLLAP
ncbi:MAG: pyridoxamine 5'-phosphate oxidase [Myxococcaceae bacterium]